MLAFLGCGASAGSLKDEQEAQLSFANSMQVAAGGHDSEQTLGGSVPAIVWRSYGVDAPFEDILAYFNSELSERGWEPGGGSSGSRTTDEFDVEAWHTRDRIFRLAHLRNPPTADAPSYSTYYEVALIGSGVPDD
jgi:hypothetical protein